VTDFFRRGSSVTTDPTPVRTNEATSPRVLLPAYQATYPLAKIRNTHAGATLATHWDLPSAAGGNGLVRLTQGTSAAAGEFGYLQPVSAALEGRVVSAYIRSSRTRSARVQILVSYEGIDELVFTKDLQAISLPVNEWVRVSYRVDDHLDFVHLTSTVSIGIGVSSSAGAGATTDLSQVLIERSSTVGDYFDALWPTPPHPYVARWAGVVGNSNSSLHRGVWNGQVTPYMLTEYASEVDPRHVVHQPIGRRDPVPVLATATLRMGTLSAFFTSLPDAAALTDLFIGGVVSLRDSDDPALDMDCVAVEPILTQALAEPTKRTLYVVKVAYAEVKR
jgi:acetyltransferase-like isoleucine patch superfamily enzyme